MKALFSFHKTVRGHLHVLREFPCEDYSISFSSENGDYHIAIVADGHGASECFRSSRGSQFAAEEALSCLKQFAESVLDNSDNGHRFYQDILTNTRYKAMTMRRLTDTIIALWHDRVKSDFVSDPPSQEEIDKYTDGKGIGDNIYHVYGTTLIAALWLPKCLLLIQQGDGRCDVFYEDGSVGQPIPWDNRCEDNITTSMCDSDVANSIRWAVVDLHDNAIIACVLESDGVEDAYRDTYIDLGDSHELMGGVHSFNKNLLLKAVSLPSDEFINYLDDMLPLFSERGLFSKAGSGDDVSIAAVAHYERVLKKAALFERDVRRYELEEKLIGKNEELRGKTRKHDILHRRFIEAESCWNDQSRQLSQISSATSNLEQEVNMLQTKLSCLQQIIELCGHDPSTVEQAINEHILSHGTETLSQLGLQLEDIVFNPLKLRTRLIKEQNKLISSLESLETRLERNTKERDAFAMQAESSKDEYEKAKAAYDEYDEEYQNIESDILRLREQIESLNSEQHSDEVDNQAVSCNDSEKEGEQTDNIEALVPVKTEADFDAKEPSLEYQGPMLMGDIAIDDEISMLPKDVRFDNDEDEED